MEHFQHFHQTSILFSSSTDFFDHRKKEEKKRKKNNNNPHSNLKNAETLMQIVENKWNVKISRQCEC